MHRRIFIPLVALSLAACADPTTAPRASTSFPESSLLHLAPNGRGDFHRYVAIGTRSCTSPDATRVNDPARYRAGSSDAAAAAIRIL